MPAYYGKEQMNYTPPAETALVTRAIDRPRTGADPGHHGFVPTGAAPLRPVGTLVLRRAGAAAERPDAQDPARYLSTRMPPGATAFVILTQTQDTYAAGEGLLPPGGFASLTRDLTASPLFRVIERTEYGLVLRYVPPA
ncbi:hypothetical protein NKH18_20375 [Streptomyces sp. M10(2022)]